MRLEFDVFENNSVFKSFYMLECFDVKVFCFYVFSVVLKFN